MDFEVFMSYGLVIGAIIQVLALVSIITHPITQAGEDPDEIPNPKTNHKDGKTMDSPHLLNNKPKRRRK